MNFKKLYGIIISFCKRTIVLYLLIGILFYWIVDSDLLRLKALNSFLPASTQWTKLAKTPEQLNDKELKEFTRYYKKVLRYMPKRADAHGMLGFCYYHLGKYNRAASHYKKAIKLEPRFFWPYFNLGMIYFQNGNYKKAVDVFQDAMATRPGDSLVFIKAAKMYQDIVKHRGDSDNVIGKRLDAGYRDCFTLLISSYYHLKKFSAMLNAATYMIDSSLKGREDAYYYAGLAAYELKEYKRGAVFFQETIKRDPQNSHAFHYLGLCLKALGKEKTAVGILIKAKSLTRSKNPIWSKDKKSEIQIF